MAIIVLGLIIALTFLLGIKIMLVSAGTALAIFIVLVLYYRNQPEPADGKPTIFKRKSSGKADPAVASPRLGSAGNNS